MAISDDLRFSDVNMVPVFGSSDWLLNLAAFSEDNSELVISPGGSASCSPLQLIVNRCFKYTRVEFEYQSDDIVPANNFKSGPYVDIRETYKDSKNTINQIISRVLGLTTFNEIDSTNNKYSLDVIIEAPNKPLADYQFKIVNTGDSNLILKPVYVYSSIDVAADQVGDVVTNVNESAEAVGFKCYYTDDSYNTLDSVSAIVSKGTRELIYKPVSSGGLLTSIVTNFGVTYEITNVPNPADIES